MFKKQKKDIWQWTIRLFNVDWYPSNRSCIKMSTRTTKPQFMPPLMVRKPAWRR